MQVDVSSNQYLLMPPDEIEVQCARVPEIHEQRQRIRPDGMISFEGLGEIYVAGKTPEQIAAELSVKVSELYTLPGERPIDVRISTFLSKRYYVLGQVYIPGPKVYTGRDTVLSALADAKPNPMAWRQRIQVIRPSHDKSIKPKIYEVNYDYMVIHGDLSKDTLLQEGDIIYVPPTVFAAIALSLEQVLRPIARAFSGVYIVTQGATGTYQHMTY
jgi:polysaccharide export outer membrane protein